MKRLSLYAALMLAPFLLLPASGAELALPCSLDPLITIPAMFALTPADLEAAFPNQEHMSENPYFINVSGSVPHITHSLHSSCE